MKWIELLYHGAVWSFWILIALAAVLTILRILAALRIRRILHENRRGNRVPLLVREALPRRFSISHAVLPLRPTDPNTRYIKADLILVSRGGIHVLQSIHRGGSIQAPREGEWTAMGRNKEPESFPSPIRGGYAAKECIGRILTQEQISNVPITVHLVTTAKRVRLSVDYEEVIPIRDLVPTLKNLDKSRFLSSAELRLCRAALTKHVRRT